MDITIFCSQFQLSLHLVPSILCQSPAWRGYSHQKENIDDALHSPVPKILQQCGWQRNLGPRVHPQLGNFWPLPFATFHHCPECQPSGQFPLREPQPCKALNFSTSTANPLTSHHTLWNGTMPHLWQAPWHLLVSVNPLDLLKVFTPSLMSGHCAASLKDEIKSSGQCLAVTFWWVFCFTSPRPAPSEWTALLPYYPGSTITHWSTGKNQWSFPPAVTPEDFSIPGCDLCPPWPLSWPLTPCPSAPSHLCQPILRMCPGFVSTLTPTTPQTIPSDCTCPPIHPSPLFSFFLFTDHKESSPGVPLGSVSFLSCLPWKTSLHPLVPLPS